MQDRSVEKLFQKQLKHYTKINHSSSISPLVELFGQWIKEKRVKKKLNIVEFGGGGGQLLKSIDEIYSNNILINLEIVEGYKTHQALKKIKFVHGSILESNLDDKSADVLIIRDVLHHLIGKDLDESLNNQILALHELKRILRPGGVILIEELVDGSNLICRLVYYLSRLNSKIGVHSEKFWISPNTIICMFTPQKLRVALKRIFPRQKFIKAEFREATNNWKGKVVHLGSPYGKFIAVIQG